jgi:hypothetical protein
MTDNWQLEDKLNELIENHNQLLIAVHTILDAIEENKRFGFQGAIDTIPIRIKINGLGLIDLLDLSPRDTEAYQPRLILTKPRELKARMEELPSAGSDETKELE